MVTVSFIAQSVFMTTTYIIRRISVLNVIDRGRSGGSAMSGKIKYVCTECGNKQSNDGDCNYSEEQTHTMVLITEEVQ